MSRSTTYKAALERAADQMTLTEGDPVENALWKLTLLSSATRTLEMPGIRQALLDKLLEVVFDQHPELLVEVADDICDRVDGWEYKGGLLAIFEETLKQAILRLELEEATGPEGP